MEEAQLARVRAREQGTGLFLSGPGSWPGPGGPVPVARSRWPGPGGRSVPSCSSPWSGFGGRWPAAGPSPGPGPRLFCPRWPGPGPGPGRLFCWSGFGPVPARASVLPVARSRSRSRTTSVLLVWFSRSRSTSVLLVWFWWPGAGAGPGAGSVFSASILSGPGGRVPVPVKRITYAVGTIIRQKQEPNGCQSQALDVASLAAVFLERLCSRRCLPGVSFLEPF